MKDKLEKISNDAAESRLKDDLQRYESRTLELGAARAAVVRAAEIPIHERVVMKCRIPRCFGYGSSAHCPPHAPEPAEIRELLKEYEWAVFFIKDVSPDVIVRGAGNIEHLVAAYREVFKIVTEIESMAFYDGHYMAMGFGAGSCRHVFCGMEQSCRALEGETCRFFLKARPSMEAVGIDVFKMADDAGWDIYPIGGDAKPENMPKGTLAGIVVVR